jgi:AraC-like DNA-binding protein
MTTREEPAVHARTSDVPEHERFDYFRDAISEIYLGIRTEWDGAGAFDAEFDAIEAGDAVLARMQAPGHVGRRDDALVRRRPDAAVYLNVGFGGAHRVEHLGRGWEVPSGRPFLLDSERPFIVDFAARPRFRLYSLRIEKDAEFAPDAEGVRRIDERIGATPVGRQLMAQVRLMCAEAEAGRDAVAAAMISPVRALLSVLASGPLDGPRRFDDYARVARGRLADPAFGIVDLAGALAVSPRTVQAVFHAERTTFGAWLLAERLELARARLDGEAWRGRSVAEIARASGFRATAHFHRAYRERFGATPGSARPALRPGAA